MPTHSYAVGKDSISKKKRSLAGDTPVQHNDVENYVLAAVVDEGVRCDTDGAALLRLVLLDDKRKWTES